MLIYNFKRPSSKDTSLTIAFCNSENFFVNGLLAIPLCIYFLSTVAPTSSTFLLLDIVTLFFSCITEMSSLERPASASVIS